MANPNFLTREFDLEIRQATVLLSSLREMKKLADKAALLVAPNVIQIFAPIRNPYAAAVLDIESDHIFDPSNSDGYSLFFDLDTWIHALRTPVFLEPSSSLSIMKSPGSMDLFCVLGVNRQLISLGEAEFGKIDIVNLITLPLYVGVIMQSYEFREFIQAFAIRQHEPTISAVQMLITPSTIRWVTPTGHYYDHPAQGFYIDGFMPGAASHFRLRWHFPLYLMLCSASICSDRVELAVLLNARGEKLIRFRYLNGDPAVAEYYFYYVEKEPPLLQQ